MQNYGVLKGSAIAYKRDDDQDPHSELLMSVDGVSYRVAINVRSSRGPVQKRLVEYLVVEDLNHPVVDRARALPEGWNPITGSPAETAAIDYIRGNLFRPKDLKPLVHTKPGPNNDLFERVEDLLHRAIDDDGAVAYAFGERWSPEANKKDQYFRFKPGNGVHLIHMNQGGAGDDGGRYRDGALLVDFPASGITHALFLKFQNQVWHTSGERALPIASAPAAPSPSSMPAASRWTAWPTPPPRLRWRVARWCSTELSHEGLEPGRLLPQATQQLGIVEGPVSGEGVVHSGDEHPPRIGVSIPIAKNHLQLFHGAQAAPLA